MCLVGKAIYRRTHAILDCLVNLHFFRPTLHNTTTAIMNSFFSLSFAAATVLLAVQPAIADPVAIPEPSSTIQLKSMTSEGCYSSSTGLTFNSTYTYQTSGYCQPLCVEMDQSVLALTGGSDCWCGDLIPPASSKVDDSYCDDPCDGYDTEMCM